MPLLVGLRLGTSSNWATARLQRNMTKNVDEMNADLEAVVNQLSEIKAPKSEHNTLKVFL